MISLHFQGIFSQKPIGKHNLFPYLSLTAFSTAARSPLLLLFSFYRQLQKHLASHCLASTPLLESISSISRQRWLHKSWMKSRPERPWSNNVVPCDVLNVEVLRTLNERIHVFPKWHKHSAEMSQHKENWKSSWFSFLLSKQVSWNYLCRSLILFTLRKQYFFLHLCWRKWK